MVTAANGREVLEPAGCERPDLILAVVMMPYLDGIGLLRKLRADAALRHTSVVLLTTRAGEQAAVEACWWPTATWPSRSPPASWSRAWATIRSCRGCVASTCVPAVVPAAR